MGNKKKGKILAVLLSGTLLGTQIPGMTAAEGAAGYTGGICGHHPVHTAECGYQEAVPEQPCRHEHTKECYEYETSCVHVHTEECYPLIAVEVPAGGQDTEGTAEDAGTAAQPQTEWVRGPEPTACTHVCSEDSGCVTKTLNCIHEDKVNADGSVTYAVHDAGCGYAPAVEGAECTFVCEICSAQSLSETETEALTVQTGIAAAGSADSGPSAKTTEAGDEGTDGDETDSETETSTEETSDSDAEPQTDEAAPDEAVTKVQAMIDALPSVEEVEQMTKDEQKEVYDKAQDAADAYFDELSEGQQAQVDLMKLMDLMNYFNGQVSTMADDVVVATVVIGGVRKDCYSLDEALMAAQNTTAQIILKQDTTLNGSFFINSVVIFIGGNHKVTGNFGIQVVETGGTFHIDSGTFESGEGGGLVCYDGTINVARGSVDAVTMGEGAAGSGAIRVDGGNIDCLYRLGDGTITINGGTIKKVVGSKGIINYFPPEEAVSIQSVTAGKITVTPLENADDENFTTTFGGAQYSLNGIIWQSSNELNCKANTSYTIYAGYSKARDRWRVSTKSAAASYTVTIPSATLTAGESTSKAEISVTVSDQTPFDLGYNGQVQVKVKGDEAVSSYGKLTLTRQGASGTVTSDMYVDGNAFTDISKPVATFTMENYNSAKAVVSFAQPTGTQTVIPAGTYSGTVTFEVSYSD